MCDWAKMKLLAVLNNLYTVKYINLILQLKKIFSKSFYDLILFAVICYLYSFEFSMW